MVDNGMTPHLLVNAANDNVKVPRASVDKGKIVLNIGPMAVKSLTLGNADVSFNARFDGKPMNIVVPVENVMAIYTRENGQGMMFGDEEEQPPPEPEKASPSRPRLKVVK